MKNKIFTLLFLVLISSTFNFISSQVVIKSGEKKSKNVFMLTSSLSWSYRFVKVPEDYQLMIREYMRELKSGTSFDIGAYYLFPAKKGIGLKFSRFQSKNFLGPLQFNYDDGTTGFGNISDNMVINFIGPSYCGFQESNAGIFKYEISLGYMGYRNDAYAPDYLLIKGSSFGIMAGLGYNFKLGQNVYFGPQISIAGGSLKKYNIEYSDGTKRTVQLEDGNAESLFRADLSANLTFKI